MGARILVVEDTPHTLELMTYLLQAHGHTVTQASDGESAVELARHERPDLVVMDIQLPGDMDGFETMRQIRSIPRLREVPIVAVTAFAMVGDREHAMGAGFTHYMTKPIDPYTFALGIDQNLPLAMKGQLVRKVPMSPVESTAPHRAEIAADAPCVLVVDDQPTNIDLLRSILEPHGYRVKSASTVVKALTSVSADHPDLVLSDIHLGAESGLDLWRLLQDDPELAEVPFAFTTATARLLDELPGPVQVIRRPVEPRTLLTKIQELIAASARS